MKTLIPTDRKILERRQAAAWTARMRAEGKTVVFANGCFDVLHVGHVRFLEGAKELGDFLIVGLNSDNSVRSLKGEGRPILPESERAALVAALSAVDAVVLFHERTADPILEEICPNIHAKGTDYTEDTVPERGTAMKHGIRIAIVGDPKGHSTKNLIRDLQGDAG